VAKATSSKSLEAFIFAFGFVRMELIAYGK